VKCLKFLLHGKSSVVDYQKLVDMMTIEAKCEKCETINTITLEEEGTKKQV
jgi:phage FluMu protein Com